MPFRLVWQLSFDKARDFFWGLNEDEDRVQLR